MPASPSSTQTDAARTRPASWGRLLLIVILIVLITLVAGALLFALAVLWTFSGGWDGIRPEAQPDGRRVVAAREQAHATLAQRQHELNELLIPATGEPLADGTADACNRGMNDWKNHTGYTLQCETGVVAVYPLPSASSNATAAAIDTHLRTLGYEPDSDMSAMDIYDNGYGSGRYRKGDHTLVLEAHAAGDPDPILIGLYPSGDAYEDNDIAALDPAITGSSVATLTVGSAQVYFED